MRQAFDSLPRSVDRAAAPMRQDPGSGVGPGPKLELARLLLLMQGLKVNWISKIDVFIFLKITIFLQLIISYYLYALLTFGVLMCMDVMECFLHALRLHW